MKELPFAIRRRGVSLLEVLISIFVLSIGLLGVVAMIPVGGAEINKANQADRAAVVGRYALREVKVRRMLEPFQLNPNVSSAPPVMMWQWPSSWPTDVNTPQYVMIDPLYAATNGDYRFPSIASGSAVAMPRVNLRTYPVNSHPFLNALGAREIFVCHDDLNYEMPSDKTSRPLPVPSGLRTQFVGDYSWAAMVAPAENEAAAGLDARHRSRVTVSIIVFHKRNLLPADAEHVASATFTGGGDVRLTVTNVDDFKRVKRHHWILLYGPTGNTVLPITYRWYRVVAVGEDNANALTRDVSLAGPDWNGSTTTVQAVLIEGVVGVYTETVELSRDLLRSQ